MTMTWTHRVAGILLSLGLLACAPEHAPARVDAPTTATAQRHALEQAARRAEEHGQWSRAEIVYETLIDVTQDVDALARLEAALASVRRHRHDADELARAERWLEVGAIHEARQLLEILSSRDLASPTKRQLDTLRRRLTQAESSSAVP